MSCSKTSNLVLNAMLGENEKNKNVVHEQKQNNFVEILQMKKINSQLNDVVVVVDESHWIFELNPFACCFQY